MRNVLFENQKIMLALKSDVRHKREFTVLKKLGEGSNCIAYRAMDVGSQLPVVIKECFPLNIANRNLSGVVAWNTLTDEDSAKERFCAAFEMQRKLQSTEELMNTSTHLIDGLYVGNNTLYTITDIQNAKTYNEETDVSLQEICKTAKALAKTIGKYHERRLLHLGIKPQNILILPETREKILLLDFDSVIQISDVSRPGTTLSYSPTYAVPEQLQGKREKLCEATDIYAIGAVLFSRIFGRAPSSEDRGAFSDWDLVENPLVKRLSPKAHRLTKEILHKTLSASIRGRYQSAEELIAALDKLIVESDPKRRYLNSRCPVSFNYFVGRNVEHNEVNSAFASGKRAVFLHGVGGLGKTELALNYAKKYGVNFDVVAFGRYSDSLELLFKNTDFISVENDAEGKAEIDLLRNLVDERTLLIIDNFDIDVDSKLEAVLSLNCKLLFTSRYSFEEIYENDSSIAHIQVGELSLDEQETIFEHECGLKLSEEEMNAVRSILRKIGGYTLLIPLIAKQYKKDGLSLSEIQQRIYDAGIKGASGVKVSHFKDTALSNSLYGILCEVLNMAEFSDDEIHAMRSLALLGNIIIDRKAFNTWLGNQYQDAVNQLSEKSWIQLQGAGPRAKLSLHKVIGDMARSELKPDFENCGWAYELCVQIATELGPREEYAKLEYWEIPKECDSNSGHEATIVESIGRRKKAKLFLAFLECLDYSKMSNITTAIGLLSKIVLDIRFLDGNYSNDISIINDEYLTEPFLSLLNSIISSPLFPEIAGEMRFEAYRMLSTLYSNKAFV